MDINEDSKALFRSAIAEADKWLIGHGIITDVTHNTIITNLHILFPQIKLIEYFLDSQNKRVKFVIYVGFWSLLWMLLSRRRSSFLDDIISALSDYLIGYEISVVVKRHKSSKNIV